MIRIVAAFCFAMTLLCPVFCLAEEGGACSDQGRSDIRNCEAMSVGAVVVKSVVDSTPLHHLSSPLDLLFPTEYLAVGSHRRSRMDAWNRARSKPPSASTRRALLQIFLF